MKVGDWVETCRLLPGILQKIEGDHVEVFYPDLCALNEFKYVGGSCCSVYHCGVHTITPEYAIALMAIGDKELNRMYEEDYCGGKGEWETLVMNRYKEMCYARN